MARGSLLTMALLSMAVSSFCRAGEHDIPEGYVRVAAVHGVPAEVLYAVSLTETVMAPSAIAGVMKKRDADFRLPSVARPWPSMWLVRATAMPVAWKPGRHFRFF